MEVLRLRRERALWLSEFARVREIVLRLGDKDFPAEKSRLDSVAFVDDAGLSGDDKADCPGGAVDAVGRKDDGAYVE